MKSRRLSGLTLIFSWVFAGNSMAAPEKSVPVPNTIFWDGAHLASLRAGELKENLRYKELVKRLAKNARLARERGPYSVIQKDVLPPSGDKHDYLSYSRYWWPNPESPDGLPYVRRDGKTNRELLAKGDREPIGMFYDDVESLALAGYLLDDAKSAKHGAMLVRTWFLNDETKMNPHLRYAQAVPGRSEGRGSGIIDTRHFIRVLDSVALLKAANAWTESDQAGLVDWMKQYLDWLLSDPNGREESNAKNNHGNWYDAQVAAIAMFVGEKDTAQRIVESAKQKRIESGIQPDGSQPEEMERTKGLHYCVFSLSALSVLARIGEHVDVDLWNHESSDGRSIRRGLDFVMPYLIGEKQWPHMQIEKMYVSPSDAGLFLYAASRYKEPRYLRGVEEDLRNPMRFYYAPLQFPAK